MCHTRFTFFRNFGCYSHVFVVSQLLSKGVRVLKSSPGKNVVLGEESGDRASDLGGHLADVVPRRVKDHQVVRLHDAWPRPPTERGEIYTWPHARQSMVGNTDDSSLFM